MYLRCQFTLFSKLPPSTVFLTNVYDNEVNFIVPGDKGRTYKVKFQFFINFFNKIKREEKVMYSFRIKRKIL